MVGETADEGEEKIENARWEFIVFKTLNAINFEIK